MKNTEQNRIYTSAAGLSDAVPVWLAGGKGADEYAEFAADFTAAEDCAKFEFFVAADSEYNLYLDGRLIGFGQYQDFPGRLVYDRLQFEAGAGTHTLRVVAWHWGVDSLTHAKHPPYLLFELRGGHGELILASSEHTPSRPAPGYVPYKNHIITSQLGLGCEYSAEAFYRDEELPFSPSVAASVGTEDNTFFTIERPVSRCKLLSRTEMTVVKRGFYKNPDNKAFLSDSGLLMDNADIDVPRSNADGCYLVADVGCEETGFIEFLLITKSTCRVRVGWGEHLSEGRETPRCAIHNRRFTYDYTAVPGENRRLEPMRRIGCRYLEIFCEDPDADIKYLGLVPTRLPLERTAPPRIAEGGLRRRIYDCAVRTLELCMHEHYEDCPWREQSLYTMDSRTQMLCGYAAFRGGNAEFARASLDIISRSVRSDGLLSLCAPSVIERPIPCYSLAYIMQMCEYGRFTGDAAFLAEKLPALEGPAKVFIDRLDPAFGLPRRFPDRLGYWNYYEWSPTLDGSAVHRNTPDDALPIEAPMCAFLSIACSGLAEIFDMCAATGEKTGDKTAEYAEKAEKYRSIARETAHKVGEVFFDRGAGLFRSFTDRPEAPFAVLTQALCLLCGAGEGKNTDACLAAVASNGTAAGHPSEQPNGQPSIIPATLSSAVFRYDALYAADPEVYAPIILGELDRDGKYMLDRGATSFWETIKGPSAFGGAGSLCHGWSALAALWYHRLTGK